MQNSTALRFLVLAAMIAMTWAAAIESEPEELATAEQRYYGFGGPSLGLYGGRYGGFGGNYYRGFGDYGRPYGGFGGFY